MIDKGSRETKPTPGGDNEVKVHGFKTKEAILGQKMGKLGIAVNQDRIAQGDADYIDRKINEYELKEEEA